MGDRTYRGFIPGDDEQSTWGGMRGGRDWSMMVGDGEQGGPHPSAGGPMIEARNLTKHYGATVAVDDLSFDVRPGLVTGFLGPNGAGKTTTMRMILGLDHPNSGQVTVAGKSYRDLPAPLHEVGALLDAKAMHGGRSAYNHLLVLA